jgi:hypothetical protein
MTEQTSGDYGLIPPESSSGVPEIRDIRDETSRDIRGKREDEDFETETARLMEKCRVQHGDPRELYRCIG